MCSPLFGLAAKGNGIRPLSLISPAAAIMTGGLFKKKKPAITETGATGQGGY